MLADTVEAAIRSLEKPSPAKLENTINKLVKDKFDDGQLDNAPLSINDITIVKETFIQILTSAHHKRIEYPEETGVAPSQ